MPGCLASCWWPVFLLMSIWASGGQWLCQSELTCHPARFSKDSSLPLIWARRDILWEKEPWPQNKSPESIPFCPGLKKKLSSSWCSRQLVVLSTFFLELSPLMTFSETLPSSLIIYRCHVSHAADSVRLVINIFPYFCPFIQIQVILLSLSLNIVPSRESPGDSFSARGFSAFIYFWKLKET